MDFFHQVKSILLVLQVPQVSGILTPSFLPPASVVEVKELVPSVCLWTHSQPNCLTYDLDFWYGDVMSHIKFCGNRTVKHTMQAFSFYMFSYDYTKLYQLKWNHFSPNVCRKYDELTFSTFVQAYMTFCFCCLTLSTVLALLCISILLTSLVFVSHI